MQYDQGDAEDGKSELIALDIASGAIVWQTQRPVANSWSSPVVVRIEGRDTIVTSADPWVIAYDPVAGTELWRAECLEGDGAPSATYAAGRVIAGNTGSIMAAIRPDGTGNVTKNKKILMWEFEDDIPDICTPVGDDKYVYMVTSDGLITCLDVRTGKKVYDKDLEMSIVASPVSAAVPSPHSSR